VGLLDRGLRLGRRSHNASSFDVKFDLPDDARRGAPKAVSALAAILESIFAHGEDITVDHLAMPIGAVDADPRPVALDHKRAHAPQFDTRVSSTPATQDLRGQVNALAARRCF
jgi:hypothetical protein